MAVSITRNIHVADTREHEETAARSIRAAEGTTHWDSPDVPRLADPAARIRARRSITIHVINPRRGFVSASVPQLIRADTFFRDRRKRET